MTTSTEQEVVWRVRYVNDNETKLRMIEIHTFSHDVMDLIEEIDAGDQFDGSRILSIRNITLKAERVKAKKKT